jgi:hypothetical protein
LRSLRARQHGREHNSQFRFILRLGFGQASLKKLGKLIIHKGEYGIFHLAFDIKPGVMAEEF